MSIRDWNPPRSERPVPHLSAGRHLIPQRYIVGWPDGIVKVGATDFGKRRWGPFLASGGTMLDLAYYGRLIESLEGEVWLQRRLDLEFPRAFRDREDAVKLLGRRGAGYSECYTIDRERWPEVIDLARAA